MKKSLPLFFIAISFSIAADAQIGKGSVYLGGDIGGYTEKRKSEAAPTKTKGLYLTPIVGKAIRTNLILGVSAGVYLSQTDAQPGDARQKAKGFNSGVFLRRYKNIGNSGFYIYVHGGLGVNYLSQEWMNFNVSYHEINRTTVGITAYPGISYAISKRFHLETGFNNLLMINYTHEKGESGIPQNSYKTNGFSISSSLNNSNALNLGFRVLIGK